MIDKVHLNDPPILPWETHGRCLFRGQVGSKSECYTLLHMSSAKQSKYKLVLKKENNYTKLNSKNLKLTLKTLKFINYYKFHFLNFVSFTFSFISKNTQIFEKN